MTMPRVVDRIRRWWLVLRYQKRAIVVLEERAQAELAHVRRLTRARQAKNGGSLNDLAESIERTVEEGR
jgi:hypothetical protein